MKRFNVHCFGARPDDSDIEECADGDWVPASEALELESRLAAAIELLAEIAESSNTGRSWRGAIRPLLAAQPAAPGYCPFSGPGKACACGEPGCPAAPPRTEEPDLDVSDWAVPPTPARTEAEQRVLDDVVAGVRCYANIEALRHERGIK